MKTNKSPEHKKHPTAQRCYKTESVPLILGNPKKDSFWKHPRVSPIVGKSPTTRRRTRE